MRMEDNVKMEDGSTCTVALVRDDHFICEAGRKHMFGDMTHVNGTMVNIKTEKKSVEKVVTKPVMKDEVKKDEPKKVEAPKKEKEKKPKVEKVVKD